MNLTGRPLLALLSMSFLWGYAWTGIKIGLMDAGPFTFVALRVGIGALCLLLILPLTGRPFWPTRNAELIKLGLVQTTALLVLSTWAVAEGTAGRAAFLAYTMPFFTLLLAWPFLGERVRGLQWLSIVLAALGLMVIVQPWGLSGDITDKILAVGAGLAWAISAIMVKQLQRREPMDLISMTAWQMFYGAIPLVALALIVPEPAVVWSARFIVVLFLVAVVTTAFGWLLWLYVLNRLSAGTASLSTLAAPVIAMVSSSFHLGERPDTIELAGIALIAAALLTLSITVARGQAKLGRATSQNEAR